MGTLEDLEVLKLTSLITADYRKALEKSITFEYGEFPQCDEQKLAEEVNKIISKYDSDTLSKVDLTEIQQSTLKEVLKEGKERAYKNYLSQKRTEEEEMEE